MSAFLCRCKKIMTEDPSRHFTGCPLREQYPTSLGARAIYVAGGSNERMLIRAYMQVLRDHGYEVTHDWTTIPHWDRACTDEELAEQAQIDLDAIRRANVFWYVAPDTAMLESQGKVYYRGRSEGSHAELGAALVLGKRVVVSGELGPSRVFPRLAMHRFKHHAEALEFLQARPWTHEQEKTHG